jgi:hypothetical protein
MTNSSDNGYMQLHDNSNTYNEVLIHSSGDSYFNGGNVGIGTNTPATKLQVGNSTEQHVWIKTASLAGHYSGIKLTRGNGTWSNNSNNNFGLAVTDNGFSIGKYTDPGSNSTGRSDYLTINAGGNVGIGTTNPSAKLEVSGNTRITGNLLMGGYSQDGTPSKIHIGSNNSDIPTGLDPALLYVGGDHDLNGTLLKVADYNNDGSTSKVVHFISENNQDDYFFTPDVNGGKHYYRGNVGIGTTSPQFPLHVYGSVNTSAHGKYGIYENASRGGVSANVGGGYDYTNRGYTRAYGTNLYVGMKVENGIWCGSIVTSSDQRIKDITGVSNSKNDLSILSTIKVTDYKMKDKAIYGQKTTKKVIAQQLKSVYPQAVSLQTDVIPDIYKISEIKEGYIKLETELKKGDKVKLIFEDNEEVVEVLSADKNGFTVNNKNEGKVFVFGKQVDDFHVVDYDAVSMLNVSATQELYKLILKQQKTIEKQKTQISAQIEESKKTQSNFDERIKNLEILFNISKLNE